MKYLNEIWYPLHDDKALPRTDTLEQHRTMWRSVVFYHCERTRSTVSRSEYLLF